MEKSGKIKLSRGTGVAWVRRADSALALAWEEPWWGLGVELESW